MQFVYYNQSKLKQIKTGVSCTPLKILFPSNVCKSQHMPMTKTLTASNK